MRRSVGNPGPHLRTTLIRPPKETCSEKFHHFFWDERNKTCMTRTPKNWLSIWIYYVIFVLIVILIFYISMAIAIYAAGKKPHYTLDDSPIGDSPGLNYFPFENGRPLIWLSANKSYDRYVDLIKEELDKIKEDNPLFKESDLGDCAKPPFGYNDKTPCVFFRLNRIYDWVPNPYINGNHLPKEVPASVRKLIQTETTPKVWLSCEGSTAKDRDHISLTEDFFKFQGPKGFDTSPFPFDGQKTFADPIVAVKLSESKSNKVLYSFTCKAWAKKLNSEKSSAELAFYFE